MASLNKTKSVSASNVRPAAYPIKDPFPMLFKNLPISAGFGRGSTELGVPTANVPLNPLLADLDTGVYYGWCKLHPRPNQKPCLQHSELHNRDLEFNYGHELEEQELKILPMVMSIGWNPTYDDLKKKAVEIHILHKFESNFYGANVDFSILGFLRPELEFIDLQTLKDEINTDIEITKELLAKEEQIALKSSLA